MHSINGAREGKSRSVSLVTVFKVAYFVREGNVVRMSCPGHSCVLAGCTVHRVKVVGQVLTTAPLGRKSDLTKTVGRAGRHRTTQTRSQVVYYNPESLRRV